MKNQAASNLDYSSESDIEFSYKHSEKKDQILTDQEFNYVYEVTDTNQPFQKQVRAHIC